MMGFRRAEFKLNFRISFSIRNKKKIPSLNSNEEEVKKYNDTKLGNTTGNVSVVEFRENEVKKDERRRMKKRGREKGTEERERKRKGTKSENLKLIRLAPCLNPTYALQCTFKNKPKGVLLSRLRRSGKRGTKKA